jgi:hypothetical protein
MHTYKTVLSAIWTRINNASYKNLRMPLSDEYFDFMDVMHKHMRVLECVRHGVKPDCVDAFLRACSSAEIYRSHAKEPKLTYADSYYHSGSAIDWSIESHAKAEKAENVANSYLN